MCQASNRVSQNVYAREAGHAEAAMIASRDGVLSAAQDFELNCDVRVLTAFGQWSFCAVSFFFRWLAALLRFSV